MPGYLRKGGKVGPELDHGCELLTLPYLSSCIFAQSSDSAFLNRKFGSCAENEGCDPISLFIVT